MDRSFIDGGGGNVYNNNIVALSNPYFGNNATNNNYLGISQADIFVNQSGYATSYEHDYHLKKPELYFGTDGTQPFQANRWHVEFCEYTVFYEAASHGQWK